MTTIHNINKKELIQADSVMHDQPYLDNADSNKLSQANMASQTPLLSQAHEAQKNQPLNNLIKDSLHHPKQNQILAALPLASLTDLSQHLQLIRLPVGKMLYEPSEELRYAYFPINCIISLQHLLESGRTSETAGVGNEGMLGIALFMGGDSTPSSAVVQITGYAYQIESNALKNAFKSDILFRGLLLRYTQVLLTQISLTAVCNRHHSLQQQLCRWLLLTLDRLPSDQITMTQEQVAGMLGVRREGITEAAGYLQRVGLISYRRGHITVINRTGIESHVCECYGVLKKELSRLLPEAI